MLPKHQFSITKNPNGAIAAPYGAEQLTVLNPAGLQAARHEITTWPGYQATPLVSLPGLAKSANVAALLYKDEGWRFGLGSFKPVGGAYAVFRVIENEIRRTVGQQVTSTDMFAGQHRDAVSRVTICAATDGNHGRSVAWGSNMFGCRCVIYINEAVSEQREKAIASYGAEVRRVPGSFDDAVRMASQISAAEGWHVVPDTAAGGDVDAARNVTQGYALVADEIISQLSADERPSHLFLQAGVGGLASAICGQFWQAYGTERPISVIVEPPSAGCWFESFKAGEPVTVSGELDSLMGGLACGEPSPLAWSILNTGAQSAMTIPDEAAAQTMRLLAAGEGGDRPIVGGESGVAGLAAFLLASQDADARALLELDETSRVIVVGSEGDTDPQSYSQIVGRTGDQVRASAAGL